MDKFVDNKAFKKILNKKRKAVKRARQAVWKLKSQKFLNSDEWKKLRYEALLKYGRRCMCCGATPDDGARIHVDHIRPRSKFPDLALDLNNLQVLCHMCNYGKSNRDMTDFRGDALDDEYRSIVGPPMRLQ